MDTVDFRGPTPYSLDRKLTAAGGVTVVVLTVAMVTGHSLLCGWLEDSVKETR